VRFWCRHFGSREAVRVDAGAWRWKPPEEQLIGIESRELVGSGIPELYPGFVTESLQPQGGVCGNDQQGHHGNQQEEPEEFAESSAAPSNEHRAGDEERSGKVAEGHTGSERLFQREIQEDQGRDEGGYGIDGWDWCEGSTEFVDDLDSFYDSKEENFDCMILLDMVGGNGLQFIKEEHSTSSLLDEIFEIGRQLGFYNEFPIISTSSSVLDDHVAFLEEGIPSADLIINFWANPEWPHHHTTEDDLSHISRKSLEITGKTVEQFIYNNYYDKLNKNYQGNYPWKQDTSYPDAGLIIIFISLIAVVIVIPILYYFRHNRNNKNEIVKT